MKDKLANRAPLAIAIVISLAMWFLLVPRFNLSWSIPLAAIASFALGITSGVVSARLMRSRKRQPR